MESIFFKTYIFQENIRKNFKIKIPLFSSTLYLDWIYLDSRKEIEHILVKRRGRLMIFKYFLIVKNHSLDGESRKIEDTITHAQYLSYKQNSITHVVKKRKKFSYSKDGKTFEITYDRYQNNLAPLSVITVNSQREEDLRIFNINDLVSSLAEESQLSGLELVYHIIKKRFP